MRLFFQGRRTKDEEQRMKEIVLIHEAFYPRTKDEGRRTKMKKKIKMINDHESSLSRTKDEGRKTKEN